MYKYENLAVHFTGLDLFNWIKGVPRNVRKVTVFRTQRSTVSNMHKIVLADLSKIIPGMTTNQAMLSLGSSKISEDVTDLKDNKQDILTSKKLKTSELLYVVTDPHKDHIAFEVFKTLEDLYKLLNKLDPVHLTDMSVCGVNLDLDGKTAVFVTAASLTFNVYYGGAEAALDYTQFKG